jgi:hypothetical protein
MRNGLLLLIGVVLLYLASSLVLQGIYGPSYGFLQGEDSWVPDGRGGWTEHGSPTTPPPAVPSVHVPIMVRYLPIFLPALLLILFLFTPLKGHLEKDETKSGETLPGESGQNAL